MRVNRLDIMGAFPFLYIDEITAITSTIRCGFSVYVQTKNTAITFQIIDMEFLGGRFLADKAVKTVQIDNATIFQGKGCNSFRPHRIDFSTYLILLITIGNPLGPIGNRKVQRPILFGFRIICLRTMPIRLIIG